MLFIKCKSVDAFSGMDFSMDVWQKMWTFICYIERMLLNPDYHVQQFTLKNVIKKLKTKANVENLQLKNVAIFP